MIRKFENSFQVFPKHTNHMSPCIFGGAFFSELDLNAATCVRRALYASETCEASVTHKVLELEFYMPCYQGDLIYVTSEIVDLGTKSIKIYTVAERETPDGREKIADVTFVFISVEHVRDIKDKPRMLPYKAHGLKMPEKCIKCNMLKEGGMVDEGLCLCDL